MRSRTKTRLFVLIVTAFLLLGGLQYWLWRVRERQTMAFELTAIAKALAAYSELSGGLLPDGFSSMQDVGVLRYVGDGVYRIGENVGTYSFPGTAGEYVDSNAMEIVWNNGSQVSSRTIIVPRNRSDWAINMSAKINASLAEVIAAHKTTP